MQTTTEFQKTQQTFGIHVLSPRERGVKFEGPMAIELYQKIMGVPWVITFDQAHAVFTQDSVQISNKKCIVVSCVIVCVLRAQLWHS